MLVVSNGMPKSGSTYLRNLIAGCLNNKYRCLVQSNLLSITQEANINRIGGYIPNLDQALLSQISIKAKDKGPVVIKTHESISSLQPWTKHSCTLFVYTYRHPLDVLLSARDHAIRSANLNGTEFECFLDDDKAILATKDFCKTGIEWRNSGHAHMVKYEDLVKNPRDTIQQLFEATGIHMSIPCVEKAINDEINTRAKGKNQFNKGLTTRYKEEMLNPLLSKCINNLAIETEALGYKI